LHSAGPPRALGLTACPAQLPPSAQHSSNDSSSDAQLSILSMQRCKSPGYS
jgi:hypothetical protein